MAETVDWTKSMQQTYEYYKVDPDSWRDSEQLLNVTASSIVFDDSTDTKASATIDIVGESEECYVRIYLVAIQNGGTFKEPLGTFLVQTPTKKFNGKYTSETLDAYSPLTELKEKYPPIGYALLKNTPIIEHHKIFVGCTSSTIPTITLGNNDFSFRELFEEWEIRIDDIWQPFGMKEYKEDFEE